MTGCFSYLHKPLECDSKTPPQSSSQSSIPGSASEAVLISIFIPSGQTPPLKMSWQVHRGRLWLKCYQSNQLLQTTILRPGGGGGGLETIMTGRLTLSELLSKCDWKLFASIAGGHAKVSQSYAKVYLSVFCKSISNDYPLDCRPTWCRVEV